MKDKTTPGTWEPVYISGCILGVGVPMAISIGSAHKMVCSTLCEGDKESELPRREADAKLIAQAKPMRDLLFDLASGKAPNNSNPMDALCHFQDKARALLAEMKATP